MKLCEILKLNKFRIQTLCDELPSIFKLTFYIERKFLTKVKGEDREVTAEQLMSHGESNRIVIIADVAGMGKSTSLSFFAKKIKEMSPTCWVIFVDLKQHTLSYANDNLDSQMININHVFFVEFLNIERNIDQKLFEHFYQNGKLIFLFDGFDEISPKFKLFVLKILQTIKTSTKNHLWITTRLHLEQELLAKFHTPTYRLKPFSVEDQVEFLVKYWSMQKSKVSDEKMEIAAYNLLGNFDASIRRRYKFHISISELKICYFEIPLQVRMLAEIHNEKKFIELLTSSTSYQQLSMFEFYQIFFEKAIRIWMEKGSLARDENVKIITSSSDLLKIHHKKALEYLIGKSFADLFDLPELKKPLTSEMISRVGILSFKQNGEIEFVHQTFAEYFIADFMFSQKPTGSSTEALSDLFLNVMLDRKNVKIRKFLNDKLESSEEINELITEKFSERMQVSLQKESNQSVLEHITREEQTTLIKIILKTLKINDDIKTKLIEHENQALHFAVNIGKIKSFETLWNCIDFLNLDQRKKLLFGKDILGRNILHCALIIGKLTIECILNTAAQILEPIEFESWLFEKDNDSETTLYRALGYGNAEVFLEIWDWIKRKLSTDKQKMFLLEKGLCSKSVLMLSVALNHENIFEVILNAAENLLTMDELNSFLFYKDEEGSTALFVSYHSDSDDTSHHFSTLWDFIKRNLLKEDQKSLLMIQNNVGTNVLHEAIEKNDNKLVAAILEVCKKILTVDELRSFLNSMDKLGYTAFNLAPLTDDVVIFRHLWQALAMNFNEEEQRALMRDKLKFEKKFDEDVRQKLSEIILETPRNLVKIEEFTRIFEIEKLKSKNSCRTYDRDSISVSTRYCMAAINHENKSRIFNAQNIK